MKTEIAILNYVKYEKDGKKRTLINFVFSDIQESNNSVGVSVLTQFYDGHEVFNKLSKDLILKKVVAEFEIKEDMFNPLECRKILKSVNNINLY